MYKHQPRLPVELTTLPPSTMDEGENSSKEVRAEDLEQYMKSMIDWAEKVNEKVKVNIESAQQKQKKQYDAKHKPPISSIGEKVWEERTHEKEESLTGTGQGHVR